MIALVLAAAATVLALGVAPAGADGDPASDILYFQDVFLPFPKPSSSETQKVTAAVASANKSGLRIKVALIASPQDLGSVPSLFGRAQIYAQFLGVELSSFYKQRLLVVMPGGFGVYDGGKSVAAEQRALEGITPGNSADGVADAAATAVKKLKSSIGTSRRGDVKAPKVKALTSSAKRGGTAKLRFTVSDNSGRAREEIRVYGKNLLLYGLIKRPLARLKAKVPLVATWRVPASVTPAGLHFCVLAADAAGNLSAASCAPVRLT